MREGYGLGTRVALIVGTIVVVWLGIGVAAVMLIPGGTGTPDVAEAITPTPTYTPTAFRTITVTNTGAGTNYLQLTSKYADYQVTFLAPTPAGCVSMSMDLGPLSDEYRTTYQKDFWYLDAPCVDNGESVTIEIRSYTIPDSDPNPVIGTWMCLDSDFDMLCDVDEPAMGTDPNNSDTDDDGYRDHPPIWGHRAFSVDPRVDNCPLVPGGQANTDANFLNMSPYPNDLTWPMSDGLGDVCDPDDDNDRLTDAQEAVNPPCPSASGPTSATLRDTDGDGLLDGAECALGIDPASPGALPIPSAADDPDKDRLATSIELAIGSNPNDPDSDDDSVIDSVEFIFLGSDLLATNSDGDLCSDGKEVATHNLDAVVNAIDLGWVASAFGPVTTTYARNWDMDKNGNVSAIDLGFVARQFGGCTP